MAETNNYRLNILNPMILGMMKRSKHVGSIDIIQQLLIIDVTCAAKTPLDFLHLVELIRKIDHSM